MYSQNNEELLILSYFKDFKGNLLDLGANDGKTLSNSLKLIELGWKGYLVEPSPTAFKRLTELHKDNKLVKFYQYAISNQNGKANMFDSGSLLSSKDKALVSTLVEKETKRWNGKVKFEDIEVETINFATLLKKIKIKTIDFLTIDIEGLDWEVLQQIDLTDLGVKMLIVETNGIENQKYISYAKSHGLNLISQNGENLIFTR